MFSRFQVLVSGLQVLDKSYTTTDHVRKILRSLPPKWRPKVTAFQEAKDLDLVSLEDLISSLKTHEMELMTDESTKKIKGIALSSKSSSKALKAKVIESEDEASEEGHEVESEDEEEMVLMAAKVSQWAKRSKKYAGKFGSSSKKVGATKEKKEEQNKCFKCNKPGHFIADCPENQNRSSKKTSSKEKYKSKLKKGFLATWEDLDKDSDSDGDEEANMALIATTSDKAFVDDPNSSIASLAALFKHSILLRISTASSPSNNPLTTLTISSLSTKPPSLTFGLKATFTPLHNIAAFIPCSANNGHAITGTP
jgi:hypothetical protein